MAVKAKRNFETGLTEIYDMAMELGDGEQGTGFKCPFCEGGDKKERSFSVKREAGKAQYICHRASCGRRGVIPATGTAIVKDKPETEMAPFQRAVSSLVELPNEMKKLLEERYYFNSTDFGRLDAKWAPAMERMFMPICSLDYQKSGGTLRSFKPDVKPKTYTYVNKFDRPTQAWYRNWSNGTTDNILIVEDQLSAARVANVTSAVALCGTNINLQGIREIANVDPQEVVFCLDADAFKTGLALQAKWGGMFKKCKVVKPPKDLKNLNRVELQDFIRSSFSRWKYA